MGRNNIEQRTNDVNWGVNLTTQEKFKYELLEENDCRMLEVSQGLNMMQVQRAIKINGNCNIKIGNRLNIKGEVRKVNAIAEAKDNLQQGKYKGSLGAFTGSLHIGLE